MTDPADMTEAEHLHWESLVEQQGLPANLRKRADWLESRSFAELHGNLERFAADEIERLRTQNQQLLTACKTFVECAVLAHEYWDADQDHKVGKLVIAMAGYIKGYRADLDAAHAAMIPPSTSPSKG